LADETPLDETPVQDPSRDQAQAQAELETTEQRPEITPPTIEKRALVVVAHPDDAEFSCGATAAKWARDGWEVSFLIVTDATGGGDDHATDVGPAARKVIADTRKAEQRAAAEQLGVSNVEFLDYPDGRIEPTLELRRDLVRVMRRLRPWIVICPSPERRWDPFFIGRHHPDHLAVGVATSAAVYPAVRNAWDFPELLDEGLREWRVHELWVVGAPIANHYVDVTETVDAKIEALRCHDSQLGKHFTEVERSVRRGLAMIGARYGVGSAEEFHRVVM
jgi:LmbE family N-acetylglucosaminyl deacetylase